MYFFGHLKHLIFTLFVRFVATCSPNHWLYTAYGTVSLCTFFAFHLGILIRRVFFLHNQLLYCVANGTAMVALYDFLHFYIVSQACTRFLCTLPYFPIYQINYFLNMTTSFWKMFNMVTSAHRSAFAQ